MRMEMRMKMRMKMKKSGVQGDIYTTYRCFQLTGDKLKTGKG